MDLATIRFRQKAKQVFTKKPQSYYLRGEILVKTNIFENFRNNPNFLAYFLDLSGGFKCKTP